MAVESKCCLTSCLFCDHFATTLLSSSRLYLPSPGASLFANIWEIKSKSCLASSYFAITLLSFFRFVTGLDPISLVKFLFRIGCLREVEQITVSVIFPNGRTQKFIEQLHGTVFDLKVQVQKELGHPVGEQQLFLLPASSSSSGDQFLLELNNSQQQPMNNDDAFHSDSHVALMIHGEWRLC